MVYAVSTHKNLDALWLKILYSLKCFPNPIDVRIIVQVL